MRISNLICASLIFSSAFACGDDETPPAQTGLEIVGQYDNNFGGIEVITSTAWNDTAVRRFENAENWAVTQNSADAMFGPNEFNRLVWTEPNGGEFYYCYADFGLPTLEAAVSSTQAVDSSDPANGGCGMFSWTRLSERGTE